MRKLHLFMFLIGVCGTLAAQSSDAPEILAPAIDNYLSAKHGSAHPLAQHGATFVAEGSRYKVNPRFLVAITGGETGFGTHICAPNNAFNWFWNGSCSTSPFDTWDSGIHTVSHFMQKSYILHGYTTIPVISKKYCTQGCEHWISLIGLFYSDLGGDPNAPVMWSGAAPAQVGTTAPDPAPAPVPTPARVPLPEPTPTAPPAATAAEATLAGRLTNVSRSGPFYSTNQTLRITVVAVAEHLGTLQPRSVSLLLNGGGASQVIASMSPLPPTEDASSRGYWAEIVYPEATLRGKTLGVEMMLSNGSSKKIVQTVRATEMAIPSSHAVLFLALSSVLGLALLGAVGYAVARARGGRTSGAATATPAATK